MKAAAFSNQAPVGGFDTTCCKIKFAEWVKGNYAISFIDMKSS
jgi:endogenous inhibitor of DNA gyrase (YacG/DUF329 family)